jgi:hypothetical protein
MTKTLIAMATVSVVIFLVMGILEINLPDVSVIRFYIGIISGLSFLVSASLAIITATAKRIFG